MSIPSAEMADAMRGASAPGSMTTAAPDGSQTARYAFSPNPPPVKVRTSTASVPEGHQTVKELPHPQPPEAFGLRKVKPWPIMLLT